MKYKPHTLINNLKHIICLRLLLIFFITGSCSRNNSDSVTKQPNVVFVFADQWRAQSTGFNGNSDVITPNIDKLADESVIFSNAIVNMPVSSPYRASLLTGQYPLTHGMFMNDANFNPDANTMGKIFK